jgi:hypothetical protein
MGGTGVLTEKTETSAPAAPSPPRRRSSLLDPDVLRWTGVILVVRLVVLGVALYVMRGWKDDPSRDLGFHAFLAEDPMLHIRQEWLPQYPPLLGMAEALFFSPWRALGLAPYTALRIGSVTWDVLAGWMTVATVSVIRPDRTKMAGLLYALTPLTWIASAAAGQDETIAAFFIAASLWCLATDRRGWARGIVVLGLFVAKLVLLPMLVALVLARPPGRRLREAVVTVGSVVGVSAAYRLFMGTDGLSSQTAYKPRWVTFSVSPWGWLVGNDEVNAHTAHLWGQSLAALLLAGVVFFVLRNPPAGEGTGVVPVVVAAHVTAAMLLVSFAVLTVVNPEYVALMAPAIVVVARSYRDAIWMTALAVLPWLTDTAFAVIRRGPDRESWPLVGPVYWTSDGGSAGHQTVNRLHLLFAVGSSALMIGIAVSLLVRLRRQPGVGAT